LVQSQALPDKIVPIGMIMQTVSDSQSLGALIRAERKAQGLTQEQLAALSGVGIRFVRELELGKESCRLGLTLTVMKTLGMRVNVTSRSAP
jgi:y4mF family transcriptional regulator